MALTHRRCLYLFFATLLLLLTTSLGFRNIDSTKFSRTASGARLAKWYSGLGYKQSVLKHHGRNARVAIVNSPDWHDEVFAAFMHSFSMVPGVDIELYVRKLRFKSGDIIDDFGLAANSSIAKPVDSFMINGDAPPDVMISTTCSLDAKYWDKAWTDLVARGRTYLFCVVHDADSWKATPGDDANLQRLKPWMEKGLVDFLVLSSHVGDTLKTQKMVTWPLASKAFETPIRVFPPVFPVRDLKPANSLAFAIQGNYQIWRRDYQGIFDRLGQLNAREQISNLTLRLVGSGERPKVPKAVEPYVKFDEKLDYHEFYQTLAYCFALLPAFADNGGYYDNKGSSTIPASLIAGVPIVADRQLLDAYTYLTEEDVWVQHLGETDMQVVSRLMSLKPEELAAKRRRVEATTKRLLAANTVNARQWLSEALQHLPQA